MATNHVLPVAGTILQYCTVPAYSSASELFGAAGVRVSEAPKRLTPRDLRRKVAEIHASLSRKNLPTLEALRLGQLYAHLYMAEKGFPVGMNMSVLSTTENGLPTLGVLPIKGGQITNRTFTIGYQVDVSVYFGLWEFTEHSLLVTGDVPQELMHHYQLQYKKFKHELSGKSGRISLSVTYGGDIPKDIQERIQEAERSGLFTDILLIFQLGRVEVNRENITKLDPLVVGRSSVQTQAGPVIHHSLLGAFDVTEKEGRAIEFATTF